MDASSELQPVEEGDTFDASVWLVQLVEAATVFAFTPGGHDRTHGVATESQAVLRRLEAVGSLPAGTCDRAFGPASLCD